MEQKKTDAEIKKELADKMNVLDINVEEDFDIDEI
jgi:hypothetical protein